MLVRGRSKTQPGKPVLLVEADSAHLPFCDGRFGAAVIVLALHEMPFSEAVTTVKEMKRVVRPGGWIVIAELNTFSRPLPALVSALMRCVEPPCFRDFTKRSLKDIFDAAALVVDDRRFFFGGLVVVTRSVAKEGNSTTVCPAVPPV